MPEMEDPNMQPPAKMGKKKDWVKEFEMEENVYEWYQEEKSKSPQDAVMKLKELRIEAKNNNNKPSEHLEQYKIDRKNKFKKNK